MQNCKPAVCEPAAVAPPHGSRRGRLSWSCSCRGSTTRCAWRCSAAQSCRSSSAPLRQPWRLQRPEQQRRQRKHPWLPSSRQPPMVQSCGCSSHSCSESWIRCRRTVRRRHGGHRSSYAPQGRGMRQRPPPHACCSSSSTTQWRRQSAAQQRSELWSRGWRPPSAVWCWQRRRQRQPRAGAVAETPC